MFHSFTQPPTQSSLPPKRSRETAFQSFNENIIARVEKTDDYETKGKIEVIFLNRTKPAPIWVFDGAKPEVGDYVLVGYINGQKNNPYMQGLFSNKAWTSNFVRVEKDRIRIQFPTDDKDVTGEDPETENDPKSHLRDDATYLAKRAYLEIDKTGIKVHIPPDMDPVMPLTIEADAVNVTTKNASITAAENVVVTATESATVTAKAASVSAAESVTIDAPSINLGVGGQPVARVGDTVEISGTDSDGDSFTATGTITSGSSSVLSV